jgi:hypothetical protein
LEKGRGEFSLGGDRGSAPTRHIRY